eukprot:TRINITY_DN8077_c0_g1_i1.p1 TRINITY_DN8077_c0_g1~~TRINITY_DN8077_c0_g1_i1.p1  ORF type:complete len:215 (+),score=24.45 TRINITY_DN8077_c0_g1_i1:577-1221(+)
MKHKQHIKYNIGRQDLNCHIDAVHAENPRADLFTGDITSEVIKNINISGIIATTSRTIMDINRPRERKNAPAIDEYRNAIREIIESKNILDEQNKLIQNYLHIALHGIRDDRNVDFEIGTRNGETCSDEILDWFLRRLETVSKKISVNKLFPGDRSKSFHRYGDPDTDYQGYGDKFQTIQVEISNNLRRNRQKELCDFFAQILIEFDNVFNNNL